MRKEGQAQINNLSSPLNKLEKSKRSRGNNKNKSFINEVEKKREKEMKQKAWGFF